MGEPRRGRIAVHSGELYVEMMGAADFAPPPGSARTGAASQRGRSRQATRDDEAARMKQSIREAAFREQMEAANKDQQRRAAERERRRDEEFHRRLDHLVSEQDTFVRAVGEDLAHARERAGRKKERLYTEWHENVFDPIQSRIDSRLAAMPDAEVSLRRREHFEAFLKESTKKGCLFRDIIIEADYDPLSCREANRLRVSANVGAKDPTHLATNLLKEKDALPALPSLSGSGAASDSGPKSRESLDVRLWDKVESTPHGRYSDKKPNPERAAKVLAVQRTTMTVDHYAAALPPAEHRAVLTREFASKGKAVPKRPPVPEHKRHLKW